MLLALENIASTTKDMLEPERRSGPRGNPNELWDLYKEGEAGAGPITNAEEKL